MSESVRNAVQRVSRRILRIGVSGAVGCGKTTTIAEVARRLDGCGICVGVVTNDVYRALDAEAIVHLSGLSGDRVIGVTTGGCPHTAIREDTTLNEAAVTELAARHANLQVALFESGGDNITVRFSRELVDKWICIIDVAGGDKLPSKGGPGITASDLLYINKADLAKFVGASLLRMYHDARDARRGLPILVGSARSERSMRRLVEYVLTWARTTASA